MKAEFGYLGHVAIELWEKSDLEIFAKLESSHNGCAGPNFSDDGCGAVEPTRSIE